MPDTYTIPWEDVASTNHFPWNYDTGFDYVAHVNGGSLFINELPSGDTLHSLTLPGGKAANSLHFCESGALAVPSEPSGTVFFYDPLAGTVSQTVTWSGTLGISSFFMPMNDITISGTNYLFINAIGFLGLFKNTGSWSFVANGTGLGVNAFNPMLCISASPNYIYYYLEGVGGGWRRASWTTGGTFGSPTTPTFPGSSGGVQHVSYHAGTGRVLVFTSTGIYSYDETLTTITVSRAGDYTTEAAADPLSTRRFITSDDNVGVLDTAQAAGGHDFWEYDAATLSLVQHVVGATADWDQQGDANLDYYGFNPTHKVIVVVTYLAGPPDPELWGFTAFEEPPEEDEFEATFTVSIGVTLTASAATIPPCPVVGSSSEVCVIGQMSNEIVVCGRPSIETPCE